jgi:ElaB/YqjD/DUF883 family membrane-anchored ribosome-binding protein
MSTQDQKPEPTGYERATEKVSAAYTSVVARAGETAQGAAAAIEANPAVALLGGLAIGAIAGALLPRGARERELLAPLGERIGEAARAALSAARDTGKQSFADAGLGTDQLRQQVNKLVEQALAAAGEAGTAAVGAARDAAAKR